jgi:hypothetical protein
LIFGLERHLQKQQKILIQNLKKQILEEKSTHNSLLIEINTLKKVRDDLSDALNLTSKEVNSFYLIFIKIILKDQETEKWKFETQKEKIERLKIESLNFDLKNEIKQILEKNTFFQNTINDLESSLTIQKSNEIIKNEYEKEFQEMDKKLKSSLKENSNIISENIKLKSESEKTKNLLKE